ncbi:hypothetical protein [Leptospira bandrabouensis]|uniref:Uncharacterized protein n=1 Tax=Leptospira bandrabouensis TaxID=2484903 RepID=A0A6H3NUW0_9LEPT|nr:hypothetical protein [Leptospira bandrabouensis]TGN07441.1 hypothetical protein EHR07_04785 [Leptospira bandrabouensis]TGN12814.1 hypothetical protein EHR08_15820 [Leptospira bandrabouensis]
MKPILIIGYIVFSIVFFPFCSSLEKQEGSISRQISLIEDIEAHLPEPERKRFQKFKENLIQEDKIIDKALSDSKKLAVKSQEMAIEKSEDSGKWKGIRNLIISLAIAWSVYSVIK